MKNNIDITGFLNKSLNNGQVLFIVPPFSRLNCCALSVHILQSIARKQGFEADIIYLNLLLAQLLGFDEYDDIYEAPMHWMLSERLFARAAHNLPPLGYSPELCNNESYSIKGRRGASETYYLKIKKFEENKYLEIESICYKFITEIVEIISGYDYQIIGCTNFIGYTNCAVALLNGLKTNNPQTKTLIGGPVCTGDMAEGISSLSEKIDYIFSGESEDTFQQFLIDFKQGHLPLHKIIRSKKQTSLDTIDLPDYSAFLQQSQLVKDNINDIELWYETSRGCTWGEKRKCNFCGIYDMNFRTKNADKIITELKQLKSISLTGKIHMSDNLMPAYLPERLKQHKDEIPSILYMQRLPFTIHQMAEMKSANINTMLPGIETLSTGVLKLLNKGTKCKDNINFLRQGHCTGIRILWFFMWAIPNDKLDFYNEILDLLPLIRHLQPPADFIPLKLYRFSNFYHQSAKYGIQNLRPWQVYYSVYPEHTNFEKISYRITGEYKSESINNQDTIQKIDKEIKFWQQHWHKFYLMLIPNPLIPNEYIVIDKRSPEIKEKSFLISFEKAKDIMTEKLYAQNNKNIDWAIKNGFGVIRDNWYIPLVTTGYDVLKKFYN